MKISPSVAYPFRPEDIDAKKPFIGAFGSFEAEETAKAIIRYCQSLNAWNPFYGNELIKFLPRSSKTEALPKAIVVIKGCAQLRGDSYIEDDEMEEGLYYVTDRFADHCQNVAPTDKII